MIRTILCRIRPKTANEDWLPLPYEQAVSMPEPEWPDYSVVITEDGQRFLALEPKPQPVVLLRPKRNANWSRVARAQLRTMAENDSWFGPDPD